MANQPIHKIKLALITAAIWDNDGFFSVDVTRAYRASDGNWQSSTSFSHADLLNVAKCAERAEIWIGRQVNAAK
ncbi:hypothetical protein [Leisingera caerulea]|uniref:Uncharacterized protein n=1 Tax=Leisingera caerulea TaxID=506591 RepID=A0A9Q9HHN0_LEICA|nr:hypothetical protein [Leisingera caerulea]UWQ53239.1 hypothetical protein K3721_14760 [Leisingera caerulea]